MSGHIQFEQGIHFRPDYYRPHRATPRITADADPSDVIYAWDLNHPLGEAVAKILRAGRKPGESAAKDLTKALEHIQRALSEISYGDGIKSPLPPEPES